mgnify:FL=1
MSQITYVTGDATRPLGTGRRLIAHVCNDVGGWGAGFVVSLSSRSKLAEKAYRKWAYEGTDNEGHPFELGQVQFATYKPDIVVANMIAQQGIRTDSEGNPPLRYAALRICLDKVGARAVRQGASVHMPRIGCGLAGGDWEKVEECVLGALVDAYGVSVTVYDRPTEE